MNITSINNDRVKEWVKLQNRKHREETGLFLVEGDHLVNIALEKGLVKELICLNSTNYSFDNMFVVTDDIMKKISKQVTSTNVIAVTYMHKDYISDDNMIILDQLQDPGNLGTIIRSAVAFGFKNICLGTGTVDIYNEKVVRASEGAIFDVNVSYLDLLSELDVIKDKGYKIIGTSLTGSSDIKGYTKDKLAVVIGNEGKGMNPLIICDDYVKINMNTEVESLNAGVAASIIMYEVYSGR